jgi:hypothetical protein
MDYHITQLMYKSWEWDFMWPGYLNKNVCQISQSWKQYDSYSLGPCTVHSHWCIHQTHQSVGTQLKITTYVQDTFYQVLFFISKLIITKHVVSFLCWYLHTFKPHPQLPNLKYRSRSLIEEKYIYCVQEHVSCASSLYTALICWLLFHIMIPKVSYF